MVTVVVLPACQPPSKKADSKAENEKTAPAEIKKLPSETALADLHLTPKAVERLGITLAPVRFEAAQRKRIFGGEVALPPGELAVVAAPLAGTLQLASEDYLPKPGTTVRRGQTIFQLQPLLTPERYIPTEAEQAQIANSNATLMSLQITADGDVEQATEEVTAARIALDRAERLLRDRAGSEKAVDDAKAVLAIAESRLKAARDRQSTLKKLTSPESKATTEPITVASPIDGVVRNYTAAPGQIVSSGATLFEVINLSTLWVRVPVYVGQLSSIDTKATVTVALPRDAASESKTTASPVPAPPVADPLSSTVDLYYAIDSLSSRFQPGERVLVELPVPGDDMALVVPAKAVLRDIYGGTWVYVSAEADHFHRQRVGLRHFTNETAVLDSGPAEGTQVVVDGAAELFGTEFGTGK